MSYQIKVSKRSLKTAKLISKIQKMLQAALVESKLTQQQVAEKLEIDRSVVNRRLNGKANLTARSIADFAFVFGKDVEIRLVDNAVQQAEDWLRQPVKVTSSNRISTNEFFHSTVQSASSHSVERVEA